MRRAPRLALLAIACTSLIAAAGACSSSEETGSGTTALGTTPGTAATGSTAAGGTATTSGPDRSETAATDEIAAWQQALNTVGCDAGVADGQIGAGTTAAMEHFQYAEGLPATGAFDDASITALEEAADAGRTVCTSDNAPRDDFGEPDCYPGVDEGCEEDNAATPTDDIESGTIEVARGQYVTTAGTCPNGLAPDQVGAVTVEITVIGASQPVIEGTATAASYGSQTWTYNWEVGEFSWTSDFCAARPAGE